MAAILWFHRRAFTSKPNYPFTSKGNHASSHLDFALTDFKQNPTKYATHDFRKNIAMDVIERIRARSERGIYGGSLALDQIRVVHHRVKLPQDCYNPLVHKNYTEGYKDFFNDLYGGNNEPLDDELYLDIKSYVKDLQTVDQLLLLLFHPYFHSVYEGLTFIPSALKVLHQLTRDQKFPRRRTRANQASLDLATIVPDALQDEWKHVYRKVCCEKGVNILESINRQSKELKDGFMPLYNAGNNGIPYVETNVIDELIFYENACHRLECHTEIRSPDEKYQAVRQVFPFVPVKVFKFFWIYAGYHDGHINLEFVKLLKIIFKKKGKKDHSNS